MPIDESVQTDGPTPIKPPSIPRLPFGWRHDVFGFDSSAVPNITRISLPSAAGEKDLREPLRANKIFANHVWIHYRLNNPKRHYGYCLVEISDPSQRERFLELLPTWRIAGKELTIQTNWLKDLAAKNFVASLSKGWYASPSSDISTCRYRGLHDRLPGHIRDARLEGRIVRAGNLPPGGSSPPLVKRVLQRLYELLYEFDVEGLMFHTRRKLLLPSGQYSGDYVYMMFSRVEDARAARRILHHNQILDYTPMTMILEARHVYPILHL
ncbi:hypothetical protein P3342_009289 [Pyrenophora teres f. teres]|nr:hypothetical protein P3342_009289 [Pyrenophora teres f. teres]